MTYEGHTFFREALPAYALGALDADEFRALEAHLQTCVDCRTELAEHQAVSEGLLAAVPPRLPSSRLRMRLAARLPSAQKVVRQKPRLAWTFGQAVVAAALVLLLAMNSLSVFQVRALQVQQAELSRRLETEQSAIAMLAYPGTRALAVSGEGVPGSLLLDEDLNTAVLMAWNLPVLPGRQTYQIWLIRAGGDRVSGGLFNAEQGRPYTLATIASPRPLSDFVGIGVTVEPQGGSPAPTGPSVLGGEF